MRERLDHAHDSAEMTPEIAITERAAARVKNHHRKCWRVFSRYYLGRLGEVEIAALLNRPEQVVKSQLNTARSCIHGYIMELER